MGDPTLTVVMAVFNGALYLREAVDSLLAQTFADFELLIVDDGSTDATRAIIESYSDRRITLLANERNLGLSRSLNRGVALARGDYVARMDADDISEQDRLATQFEFLERHPDVVVVGSSYTLIDQHGRHVGRRWVPCDDAGIRWMLQFCSPFAHSAVMMRKTALEDLAAVYDESLVYAMDYDLWIRLAELGRLANLNELLVRWRIHPDSMTGRLGDTTERFDRVVTSFVERLGWPPGDKCGNKRKGDLLCGIVSANTPDATLEELTWAIRTLSELLDDFCRRHNLDTRTNRMLRRDLLRDTSRTLHWMGHRYADRHDYRDAMRAFAAAGRLSAASLRTPDAMSLAAKLIGGRPLVSVVRQLLRGTWSG